MKLNKRYLFLIIFVAIFMNFGCRRTKKVVPESMVTGTTTIAADDALMPLMNAEIDVFQSIYNYASIDCKFVSEYDAVNLLLQEKIRLALVARPLNQKEIDYFKSIKIVPESIPLAYDAIAVIVHSGNNTTALTTYQISGILSGVLVNWEQVNGSGLTGGIKQYFDTESSGIIRSLNDSLHLNEKISGNISFAGNNLKVTEMVATDPNSIGFIGYNWLSEKESMKILETLKKVNLIAVSTAAFADSTNSIKPTVSSLFNLSYPLIRKVYAIYTDPSASLARGFLAHLTSERGQKIVYRMGLKPESDFQRLVNIKKE
ncbi:MAG: substrate-binding domain-containing protein [Prolixibacteraceae bacterium]|nr:substrate-binding domain-containing protein [Prolixibacteraceae bacterium]